MVWLGIVYTVLFLLSLYYEIDRGLPLGKTIFRIVIIAFLWEIIVMVIRGAINDRRRGN